MGANPEPEFLITSGGARFDVLSSAGDSPLCAINLLSKMVPPGLTFDACFFKQLGAHHFFSNYQFLLYEHFFAKQWVPLFGWLATIFPLSAPGR